MKEFFKKNLVYILLAIIIVLSIVCICFIVDKCCKTKVKTLTCTLKKDNQINKQIIKYDNTGTITDIEYFMIVNYENKDEYEQNKTALKNDSKAKVEFNDKKLTITHTFDREKTDQKQWYVYEVDVFEEAGYTCK